MIPKVDVKVMAVLARKDSAVNICKTLNLSESNIVFDDRGFSGGGNAWYNAKRAWQKDAGGCTHRLVLQDDIILCDDFLHYVNLCISKYPNAIWSFYNGVWLKPTCKKLNTPYAVMRGCRMSAQAICMPIEHIEPMINYTDNTLGYDFIHDDGRISFYALSKSVPVMCCIPSLVDHDMKYDSCIPHHNSKKRVSKTFFNPANENWDSDEVNYTPIIIKEIWLPKDHPRKAYVDELISELKRGLK